MTHSIFSLSILSIVLLTSCYQVQNPKLVKVLDQEMNFDKILANSQLFYDRAKASIEDLDIQKVELDSSQHFYTHSLDLVFHTSNWGKQDTFGRVKAEVDFHPFTLRNKPYWLPSEWSVEGLGDSLTTILASRASFDLTIFDDSSMQVDYILALTMGRPDYLDTTIEKSNGQTVRTVAHIYGANMSSNITFSFTDQEGSFSLAHSNLHLMKFDHNKFGPVYKSIFNSPVDLSCTLHHNFLKKEFLIVSLSDTGDQIPTP
ncbi:MAG: hypothetical protein AAFY71_10365 [Bacteroidota bacterium]